MDVESHIILTLLPAISNKLQVATYFAWELSIALKGGTERRQPRRRRETICFVTFCMFGLGPAVSATEGDDFLNENEGQLVQVVDAAKSNDDIVQKCGMC